MLVGDRLFPWVWVTAYEMQYFEVSNTLKYDASRQIWETWVLYTFSIKSTRKRIHKEVFLFVAKCKYKKGRIEQKLFCFKTRALQN